jgi:hypothetical protein
MNGKVLDTVHLGTATVLHALRVVGELGFVVVVSTALSAHYEVQYYGMEYFGQARLKWTLRGKGYHPHVSILTEGRYLLVGAIDSAYLDVVDTMEQRVVQQYRRKEYRGWSLSEVVGEVVVANYNTHVVAWHRETGDYVATLHRSTGFRGMAVHPLDTSIVLVYNQDTVTEWRAQSQETPHKHSQDMSTIAIHGKTAYDEWLLTLLDRENTRPLGGWKTYLLLIFIIAMFAQAVRI